MPPGELVVNDGSTSDSVASATSTARLDDALSMRYVCSWWRRPPTSRHKPTTPLQMIITAAKMVSRGSSALSAPPPSIIETISATSITVTASASTSVP